MLQSVVATGSTLAGHSGDALKVQDSESRSGTTGRFAMNQVVALIIFVAAAVLEVGGDAIIRKGLRGNALAPIAAGFVMLGCYGLVVNTVRWDFSRLLGVYVAVFATVSILWGLLVFKERVPASTWAGLALIVAGGLVIQFGQRAWR
jgi:small multidrug resistance family-3 protein